MNGEAPYGRSPAADALEQLKAFNRLPIGSKERREAVRASWEQMVAEEEADLLGDDA